jgi:hypothetical protein
MKFTYTTIYRVAGIDHKGPDDVELLRCAPGSVRAILTRRPDKFAGRAIDDPAIRRAIADHLATTAPWAKRFLDTAMSGGFNPEEAPHVIIQVSGDCEELTGGRIVSGDRFVVHFNAGDPSESIRTECEETVATVLASLLLEAYGTVMPMPDKVWDSVEMVRDDGKHIVPVMYFSAFEMADVDPLAAPRIA